MTIAIGRRKFLTGLAYFWRDEIRNYGVRNGRKCRGQKNSPAYRLAALDPDFLLGDSMRG
jgi:hypothetical protein